MVLESRTAGESSKRKAPVDRPSPIFHDQIKNQNYRQSYFTQSIFIGSSSTQESVSDYKIYIIYKKYIFYKLLVPTIALLSQS